MVAILLFFSLLFLLLLLLFLLLFFLPLSLSKSRCDFLLMLGLHLWLTEWTTSLIAVFSHGTWLPDPRCWRNWCNKGTMLRPSITSQEAFTELFSQTPDAFQSLYVNGSRNSGEKLAKRDVVRLEHRDISALWPSHKVKSCLPVFCYQKSVNLVDYYCQLCDLKKLKGTMDIEKL